MTSGDTGGGPASPPASSVVRRPDTTPSTSAGVQPKDAPEAEIGARIAALPFVAAFGFDPLSGYLDVTDQERRIADCMEAAGFEYVPFEPVVTPELIARSTVGLTGRPDVETGYGLSSTFLDGSSPPGVVDPNEAIRAGLGRAELEAYWLAFRGVGLEVGDGAPVEGPGGCLATSRADRSGVDQSVAQLIDRARNEVVAEARADEGLQTTDDVWVACMADVGVVASSKFDYLDGLRGEFARLYDGVVAANASGTPPSDNAVLIEFAARERQFAALDLACDDQTGFPLAYLDALSGAQQAFLDRNGPLSDG